MIMKTAITIDPIFTETDSLRQTININWLNHLKEEDLNEIAITHLCDLMLKDESHNKDYLFLPLFDLIKGYLQIPLDIDIPEELKNDLERMKKIITHIEELRVNQQQIDLNFHLFVQLIEKIIQYIDALKDQSEEISYNAD